MKKNIDFSLEQKLKSRELETVELLRGVISTIIKRFGDINDDAKTKYNALEDAEYEIKISISTIRNYLKPYGYIVKKDLHQPIVKEIPFPEYVKMRKLLDAESDNGGETVAENTKSKQELLILDYVAKAEYYKETKQISIRFSKNVHDRFEALYAKKYSMLSKQYLLSHLLDASISELEGK